jgi:hypothetical protein
VGTQRVVGAIEALPAVLDQQTVVGLYAHLGQQLTHEQEPGIMAFRSVRPGTVVKPADPRPASPRADGGRDPAEPRPVPARSVSPRAGSGSSAVRGHHPKAAAGRRNSKGRKRGTTGGGWLALLAAFVIFAVYVLPYLGR